MDHWLNLNNIIVRWESQRNIIV